MTLQLNNPMSPEQLTELKQTVEQASHGNYVPLLLIAGTLMLAFIVVIAVLISMYKRDQSENKEVQKLSIQNAKIIGAHEVEIRNLRERLKDRA